MDRRTPQLEIVQEGMTKPLLAKEITRQLRVQEALEKLRQEPSIGNVFEQASDLATTLYFDPQDNVFTQKRVQIEEDVPFENIRKALTKQDFSTTEPADERYTKLLEAMSLKEHITRELVKQIAKRENNLGLSDTERIVLLGSCELANAYDDFSFAWHKNVVMSSLAQELGKHEDEHPGEIKQYLHQRGALPNPDTLPKDSFMYITFEPNSDRTIHAQSYAQTFPVGTKSITDIISHMIDQLSVQTDKESIKLREYFATLLYAHGNTSTDIKTQDDAWKKVDEKWMQLSGRMQPLHMMESYDDQLGLRVEPEYAITFTDERSEELNTRSDDTREHMLSFLQKNFSDKTSLAPLFPAMQTSEARVRTLIAGGKRLSFRPAAQNLPNRVAVKEKYGVKILMDMKTFQQRWAIQKQYLIDLFGNEYAQNMFVPEKELIDIIASVFVAGHEIGHNAFNTTTTRENIGEKTCKDIEEHKSNLTILAAAPSFLSQEDQVKLLKGLFSFDIRSLARTKEESAKPYLNSAIVTMREFMKANILHDEDGAWIFDTDSSKIAIFFKNIQGVYQDMVDVYESQSKENAELFIQKYYTITPDVEKLMRQAKIEILTSI